MLKLGQIGEEVTTSQMMSGEFGERAANVVDRWQGVDSLAVLHEMADVRVIDLGERAVSVVVIEPDNGEYDIENVLTLGLPHKNGWTPQHSIRAKTFQQTVAPDSRLLVFPDDSFGNRHNRYTQEDKKRMSQGDSRPIAEAQMAGLEVLADELGIRNIALASGYSKAGRQALGLAAVGSDKLTVERVNADETPSKTGRKLGRLGLDFMTSGTDVNGAANEAGIPALSEIMSSVELKIDFLKFALANLDPRSISDIKSMTGSIDGIVAEAGEQIGPENIKLGYVEGSKLFDPMSLSMPPKLAKSSRLEHYVGPGLFGHASGDNVLLHAAMAWRGL